MARDNEGDEWKFNREGNWNHLEGIATDEYRSIIQSFINLF